MKNRMMILLHGVLLVFAAGCVSPRKIHELDNSEVARLYEQVEGKVVETRVNPMLYILYPVYGLPMDIASFPLDFVSMCFNEPAKGLMRSSQDIFAGKQKPAETLNIGEAFIIGFCGSFSVTRVPFVAIDNILFRHGANDYYSIGVDFNSPKDYFFPHLNNWPFTYYDQETLIGWAATAQGKEVIDNYKKKKDIR